MLPEKSHQAGSMDNNSVFRRLRYAFNLKTKDLVEVFSLGGYTVDAQTIDNMLLKDDIEGFIPASDEVLLNFLDGIITKKRGPSDQERPKEHLDNNLVLRKIKIALMLKTEDVIDIFSQSDVKISKSEVNAFFRNPSHRHFRKLGDQHLRKFLAGLSAQNKKQI
jgi:uncharacterized protein YehS (DUF1456 family)